MEGIEPIFDFSPLKEFLKRKGYHIGETEGFVKVKPEDVKPEDVTNGTMEFRSDGIFVKGKNGSEQQVFLYKKDYRMQEYGKPRFHICKCSVIDEFIQSGRFKLHYVRANTEPVPVIDLDDYGREKNVSGLPLCGYCRKKISGYAEINSTEFVDLLKAAKGDKKSDIEIEQDLFGYTRDWESVSKQFREKHNYTCEHCGLLIEDDYDKQFMHVHHINGDKLNNSEDNLKCLCLYCHAHVDKHHYRRLTSGANKILYYSFLLRYGEEGLWDINENELQKAQKFMAKIYSNNNKYNVIIENHYHGTIETLTINGQK